MSERPPILKKKEGKVHFHDSVTKTLTDGNEVIGTIQNNGENMYISLMDNEALGDEGATTVCELEPKGMETICVGKKTDKLKGMVAVLTDEEVEIASGMITKLEKEKGRKIRTEELARELKKVEINSERAIEKLKKNKVAKEENGIIELCEGMH